MSDRQFKPGHRNSPQLRGTGQMSDERYAWVKTAIGQFVIMRYDESTEGEIEVGQTIRLYHPRPGGRPISFNFSALTEQELEAMEQFFKLLFDTVRPIVQLRDKVAQDALAEGDDSYARVYRADAQFIVRERTKRADNQGLRGRPEGVPEGEGSGDSDGPVRGPGDDLAEPAPQVLGTEDDGEAAV